ncbi:glycosyltransferase family 2 protein [bacterium]|nr:glycosyltransferase family 2 protein [bacterium]
MRLGFLFIFCSIKMAFLQAAFQVPLQEKFPADQLLGPQLATYQPPVEHPLVVVILSFNNAAYYKQNLVSLFGQDYPNYSAVYVDDASTDGTGDLVAAYLQEHDVHGRVTLLRNQYNRGAMHNMYTVVSGLAPECVVVVLDGDDQFARKDVLSLINKVYNKFDVWLTYGNLQVHPFVGVTPCVGARQIPSAAFAANTVRQCKPFPADHLRTYRAWLFQCVEEKDFLDQRGRFVASASDLAAMLPMLEMAGSCKAKFVPDILYLYNVASPLNDFKLRRANQKALAQLIRGRMPYERLKSDRFPQSRLGEVADPQSNNNFHALYLK